MFSVTNRSAGNANQCCNLVTQNAFGASMPTQTALPTSHNHHRGARAAKMGHRFGRWRRSIQPAVLVKALLVLILLGNDSPGSAAERIHLTFDQRSPLSAPEEMAQRCRADVRLEPDQPSEN